ncbi:MAG: SDR family oxidoreductase [Mycobacterium sp.]
MKVLMVGATGEHGSLVLAALLRQGVTVRALVRDQHGAQRARRHGAQEAVVGDLRDEASLREAASGVDGVFHLGPAFAPDEAQMGVSMVRAAAHNGVGKFVFSGVIHPAITVMSHHAVKLPVQEALYESGMEFTILQPGMFMQNLELSFGELLPEGRITLPYAVTSKMCWVDYRDVAEVAAIAMTSDELAYGTFELCAPGRFDGVELAQLCGAVLNRHLTVEQIPRELFVRYLADGVAHETVLRMLNYYDEYGFIGGNALILRAILKREPRSLTDYIHDYLAAHN